MRYFHKAGDGAMTVEEIAAATGFSPKYVHQILLSAYRKLRRNPKVIRALRAAVQLAEEKRRRTRTWFDEEAE